LGRLGYGQYFPWTIPMLFSGAAEALTGSNATALGPVSYLLVGLTGVISTGLAIWYWRLSDQS